MITSSDPDPHDVEDAVFRAFLDLEGKDPAKVTSLVGLTKKIAYRRGQDVGRDIVRRREQIRELLADGAIRAAVLFQEDEIAAAADEEELLNDAGLPAGPAR